MLNSHLVKALQLLRPMTLLATFLAVVLVKATFPWLHTFHRWHLNPANSFSCLIARGRETKLWSGSVVCLWILRRLRIIWRRPDNDGWNLIFACFGHELRKECILGLVSALFHLEVVCQLLSSLLVSLAVLLVLRIPRVTTILGLLLLRFPQATLCGEPRRVTWRYIRFATWSRLLLFFLAASVSLPVLLKERFLPWRSLR